MLPQEFLYQLKQANPIETVMGRYVQLVRAGSLLKCQCPFHSEKTPSCVVYAGTQDPHFYCFGCHAGGDVITFLMKIEGLGYMDAVQTLAQNAGLSVPTEERDNGESKRRTRLLELNRNAAQYYYKQLCGSDKRGLQYLAQRNLDPKIIKKYGLGFAGGEWDGLLRAMKALGYTEDELIASNLCSRSQKGTLFDRFRDRVIFPIFDLRGSVIAFGGRTIDPNGQPKYLNSSDTPVFKKGRNLFSMQFAKKSQSKRLILAEGYMDVIAIHQAGFDNVVASLGTALTADQCRLMRQYAEEVVIAYDSDTAGQNATIKAVNLLRAVGIQPKILRLHDAKDPDEYIKKFGAGRFRLLLEEADDAVQYALERCKDGLDPEAVDGKVTLIEKAISVLASIENEMQRSIYISNLAKEQEVDAQLLTAQVNREIAKRRSREKKQSWQAITSLPLMQDSVNPQAVSHRKEAKAEELILCYLFRHPDDMEVIRERIQPEQFVTELYQRVYREYLNRMPQMQQFSLSIFSDCVHPDEMGRITGIEARYADVDIGENSVLDAIAVLKACDKGQAPADSLSDEDFAALFVKKRIQKNG